MSFVIFAWVMLDARCGEVIYFVPGAWSLVMYLLQVVIVALLLVCLSQTGAGDFLGVRQLLHRKVSSGLVSDGFYAIVRHPLYLLTLIFLLLSPVMSAQRALLTILSLIYFIIGALIEERRLLEEFGDRYRHYQLRVPFMIPFLKRSHQERDA
jgi:protein-S-isoprenylcysteine O-methyltransferase Ste14